MSSEKGLENTVLCSLLFSKKGCFQLVLLHGERPAHTGPPTPVGAERPHPPRPMCEYVGLGQGFCGAEGPSAVPHNWCQAGTSSVGLIPVCPTQWTNSSYHTSHPVNTQPHGKEIMGHVCGRRDERG